MTSKTSKTSKTSMTGPYCTRCGRPEAEPDHRACRQAMALEPPRYCPDCRRRLIVQVLPTGWTARCSAHGELAPRS
jgi:hypothetical protein